MKHDAFERNSALENPPKNPFLVRCDVILLKHALTKAESHICKTQNSRFTSIESERALLHVRRAKQIVCHILLNEEFDHDDVAEGQRVEGDGARVDRQHLRRLVLQQHAEVAPIAGVTGERDHLGAAGGEPRLDEELVDARADVVAVGCASVGHPDPVTPRH